MPGPDVRRVTLGCPPPVVKDDEGREYLDTQTDRSGQMICLGHIRDALLEIEEWVSSIRRTLECFDPNQCACCGDQPAADVDLEALAIQLLGDGGGDEAPVKQAPDTTKASPTQGDA